MSKRIKNAPGTVKLGTGKVGTRAKAMREEAGGSKVRLDMGRQGLECPPLYPQICASKKCAKSYLFGSPHSLSSFLPKIAGYAHGVKMWACREASVCMPCLF